MSETKVHSTDLSPNPNDQDSLTMFTFDDLLAEIDIAERRAGEKETWRLLREVLKDMIRTSSSASTADLVSGRHWALTRVEVQNYRGISNTPSFAADFSPQPGITVLHGPNGAGKSSISDAIEVALSGALSAQHSGTAGNRLLWEPVALARDSTSARVSVTLQDGPSRLYCTACIEAGNHVDWECELDDGSGRKLVKADSEWFDALKNHQPVFAYATLERRIQLSKDLAHFFEGLLALGGAFTALEDAIETRSTEAQRALDSWNQSFAALQRSIATLDAEYEPTSTLHLDPLRTPTVDQNIEDWARANSLRETGKPGGQITEQCREQIERLIVTVRSSLTCLQQAESSSEQRLLPQLQALYEHATLESENSHTRDSCPVCRSTGRNWRQSLGLLVSSLKAISQLNSDAANSAGQLNAMVQESLVPALQITADSTDAEDTRRDSENGLELAAALNVAITQHGVSAHHSVLSATRALVDWLESPSTSELLEFVVAQSDRLRAWRLERSNASTDFLAQWHRDQVQAMQAAQWKGAKRRVEELRTRLRRRRTETLERRTNKKVEDLLADVGMRIKSVSVQKTKAALELVDSSDDRLELGMLSAGQRNAMLLAPLLASVDAGPFSFLVLDDPVHAFDQIRVDLLARSLADFAKTRRVIVMTHDERLREHLMARSQDCDVRTVERDSDSGAVTLKQTGMFWSELLQDARNALEVGHTVGRSNLALTDVVRGLCRQALDNCIRDLVIRISVRSGAKADSNLSILDEEYTTEKRLRSLESIARSARIDSTPVSNARAACKAYFGGWNRSAHGNSPLSEATSEEIDTVTSACSELFELLND